MTIGFTGKSESNFDTTRRRLVIPSKFRNLFEDSCIITVGVGRLLLYKPEEWEKITLRLGANIQGEGDLRNELIIIDLYSNAELLTIDRQNRIIIPQDLVKRVNLNREVVIIGAGNRLEVWNKDTWLEFSEKMKKYREENYKEELKKLGISFGP